jgi:hypothetical protein
MIRNFVIAGCCLSLIACAAPRGGYDPPHEPPCRRDGSTIRCKAEPVSDPDRRSPDTFGIGPPTPAPQLLARSDLEPAGRGGWFGFCDRHPNGCAAIYTTVIVGAVMLWSKNSGGKGGRCKRNCEGKVVPTPPPSLPYCMGAPSDLPGFNCTKYVW